MGNFPHILDTPSAGGNYTLIDSFSVSAESALNITDIPQTYSALEFYIDNIDCDTTNDGNLQLRVSTNNGTSYLDTTIYTWGLWGVSDSSSTVNDRPGVGQTSVDLYPRSYNLPNTTINNVRLTMSNNANLIANGIVYLNWTLGLQILSTSVWAVLKGNAFINVGGPINAMSIFPKAGNLNAVGKYYGVV